MELDCLLLSKGLGVCGLRWFGRLWLYFINLCFARKSSIVLFYLFIIIIFIIIFFVVRIKERIVFCFFVFETRENCIC